VSVGNTSDPQRWVDGDLESGADNPGTAAGPAPSGPGGGGSPGDGVEGQEGRAAAESSQDSD
jgi:hypothetical protein